ncbi:hypothetical protein HY838_01750 [Candidatus Azambacteria bacterium]|nr:hypothetical protein [Candidatus Azambacteria bacterium]
MKITPKKFSFFSPLLIFFTASFIWFLILSQTVNFVAGFAMLSLISFFTFWKGLLIIRRAGELFGLKSRKQIFIVSLGAALGFSELVWVISFLPFPFFILGGVLAVIFAIIFNIFREWFKLRRDQNLFAGSDENDFKKVLAKNIILGAVLIIILIFLSPWLPSKTF